MFGWDATVRLRIRHSITSPMASAHWVEGGRVRSKCRARTQCRDPYHWLKPRLLDAQSSTFIIIKLSTVSLLHKTILHDNRPILISNIKIQPKTIDLSTRLWGITAEFCGVYSPEPRAEVNCVRLNLNTSHLVHCTPGITDTLKEFLCTPSLKV